MFAPFFVTCVYETYDRTLLPVEKFWDLCVETKIRVMITVESNCMLNRHKITACSRIFALGNVDKRWQTMTLSYLVQEHTQTQLFQNI